MRPDAPAALPPTTDSHQMLLRERARALSQPPVQPVDPRSLLELVEFRLAHENYAVETRFVREVYPLKDLTPLPCSPPHLLGLVNVRGHILPVFDIRSFFNLPDGGLIDLHTIIFVRGNDMELGLLADVIVGVRSIPLESLQPALSAHAGIRSDYLRGVTADHLIVLDLARFFADPAIVVHQELEG